MVSLIKLPGYDFPDNAMLSFKGLNDGLDTYRKGMEDARKRDATINAGNAMARGDYGTASSEIAKTGDFGAALQTRKAPLEIQKMEDEGRMRTIQEIGGIAQNIAQNPADPAALPTWQRLLAQHPRMADTLSKYGIDANDHATGAKFLVAQALGVKDPTAEALKRAQTQHALTNVIPAGSTLAIDGKPVYSAPARMPLHYEPDPANPGGYRPVPGGKEDIKFTEKKNEALARLEGVDADLANLENTIRDVRTHPGLPSNFGTRGMIPNWPGTEAANAKVMLEKLRAQGSLSALTRLREQSKTGGALGNVSNADAARLENSFAALQGAQSHEQVVQELGKLERLTQEIRQRQRGAYNRQYNATQPAETPTRSAPQDQGIPRVLSEADYSALPAGARYIAPDGSVRTKK